MKLAVKRLRKSDLSFFQIYFKDHQKSKQKGFNLDKAVLEAVFFPGLTAHLKGREKQAAFVDLVLAGPGLAPDLPLARKVKIDGKNFRLNGEYIPNPSHDGKRYADVAAGDFAIMEFTGDDSPTQVRTVLVSAQSAHDRALHRALQSWFPSGSMTLITAREIAAIIATAEPDRKHPIRQWESTAIVEEAALGSTSDLELLQRMQKRRRATVTAEALQKARLAAETAGREGEALLNAFLASKKYPGAKTHEWVASKDPCSPFDFLISDARGRQRHVDAKSTQGAFENRIYLSAAEIRHAISSGIPYDIARLYKVGASGARLRIARDVASKLAPVLTSIESFLPGVSCDSLSFEPSFFEFEKKELSV